MKQPLYDYPVFEHGRVALMDMMGDDDAIAEAARTSYGEGTKTAQDNRGLIRYLLRHKHTTPFEMVELKFYVKIPIFVARQWIRHRTANVNEYSGRYSIMKSEFYTPEDWNKQSSTNKQGSGEGLDPLELRDVNAAYVDHCETSFELYDEFIKPVDEDGYDLAREQARMHLPLSTYTELYWKIDLHNLLHFLKLRTDDHAQYEIRMFSWAMEKMVRLALPVAYEAWVDYSKKAYTMSRMEMDVLRSMVMTIHQDDILDMIHNGDGMTKREVDDFLKALNIKRG